MDGVYDVLGVCLFDFPMGLVVLTSFPLNQRINMGYGFVFLIFLWVWLL